MPYTTLVAGTTITASWANANVRDQVLTPYASSAARSSAVSSPVDGMGTVLTDVDSFDIYDGTAYRTVGYIGPALWARKTADESVASSTTLQNDDHLLLTVAANRVYTFELMLMYTAGAAGAIKVGFTFPSAATLHFNALGYKTFGTNEISLDYIASATSGTSSLPFTGGSTPTLHVRGVLITGANAGSLQLQWAQVSSSGTASTIIAGSWMRGVRVE